MGARDDEERLRIDCRIGGRMPHLGAARSFVIHRDETTPHMTVMTIPLDERGKLNARALVGSREQLSAMQTDFAERVGKAHGLERGLQGSPAHHERVQRAYAHLSDRMPL